MTVTNELLTDDIIVKEIMERFRNILVAGKTVNRKYEKNFTNFTGRTIRIPEPVYYSVTDGPDITDVQAIVQNQTDLSISFQPVIPVGLTSAERALELSSFRDIVANPIAEQLANKVDKSIFYAARLALYNYVGDPTTYINSFNTMADAGAMLTGFGVTASGRSAALSVKNYNALMKAERSANVFYEAHNKVITDEAKLSSQMKGFAGFDLYQSQNVNTLYHTVGAYAGTPLVKGAAQEGAVLLTDGWTDGSTPTTMLKAGDRFTIGSGATLVLAMNPADAVELSGETASFVVLEDVVTDGAGNASISIFPAITLTGPYQNVNMSPPNNASINIVGAASSKYLVNPAYAKECFTLAMVPLPKITAVNGGAIVHDDKLGLAIRMTPFYDGLIDRENYRFELLFGVRCFGRYGVAVLGKL